MDKKIIRIVSDLLQLHVCVCVCVCVCVYVCDSHGKVALVDYTQLYSWCGWVAIATCNSLRPLGEVV